RLDDAYCQIVLLLIDNSPRQSNGFIIYGNVQPGVGKFRLRAAAGVDLLPEFRVRQLLVRGCLRIGRKRFGRAFVAREGWWRSVWRRFVWRALLLRNHKLSSKQEHSKCEVLHNLS